MIISQNGMKIEQENYKDESELQTLLFAHPELLSEDGSDLTSIVSELSLQSGQRVDILAMTSNGNITIVEVKLKRNTQSRREVLAQIFDYISELSNYSYYELDQATNGELGRIVDGFENNKDLPRTIEDNLKNCLVKLIIATDESNDDLHRLVRFIAERAKLRVDLIEIKKYINNGEHFYSSNPVVQSSFFMTDDKPIQEKKYPLLDMIANTWEHSNLLPKIRNSKQSFRQIRIEGWPSAIHYEFTILHNQPIVYVRLDNELYSNDPRSDKISKAMEKFVGEKVYDYEIQSRPYSHNGSGKILYIPLKEDEIDKAPAIMLKLIELTKTTIDATLTQ